MYVIEFVMNLYVIKLFIFKKNIPTNTNEARSFINRIILMRETRYEVLCEQVADNSSKVKIHSSHRTPNKLADTKSSTWTVIYDN